MNTIRRGWEPSVFMMKMAHVAAWSRLSWPRTAQHKKQHKSVTPWIVRPCMRGSHSDDVF
jgi:hypothetical protein